MRDAGIKLLQLLFIHLDNLYKKNKKESRGLTLQKYRGVRYHKTTS